MPLTASEQEGDFFCDIEKAFDCVKHDICNCLKWNCML